MKFNFVCFRSRTSAWRLRTTRRRSQLKTLCCSGVRWRQQGETSHYISHQPQHLFWPKMIIYVCVFFKCCSDKHWCCATSSSGPDIKTSTSTTSPPAGGTGWPSMLSSTNTGNIFNIIIIIRPHKQVNYVLTFVCLVFHVQTWSHWLWEAEEVQCSLQSAECLQPGWATSGPHQAARPWR